MKEAMKQHKEARGVRMAKPFSGVLLLALALLSFAVVFGVSFAPSAAYAEACGAADGVAVAAAPSSGLCASGTASAVTTGPTTYTWTCTDAVVNGACGTSHGGTFATAPSTNLCNAGTASGVTDSGATFDWSCNGSGGGSNASCSATDSSPASCPALPIYCASTLCTTIPASAHGAMQGYTISCGVCNCSGTQGCDNGQWQDYFGCGAAGCPAQTVTWTVGADTCTANAPAIQAGTSTATLTDSTAPATGSATFSCPGIWGNQTMTVNGGATCSP